MLTKLYKLHFYAFLPPACLQNQKQKAKKLIKSVPMPAERLAARQLIRDAVTKYEVLRQRFPKHWDRDYVVPPPQPDPAPGPDAHAKAKAAPLAKAKPQGRPRGSWPYRVWRSKQPIEESITVDHAAKAILGRFSN